MGESLELRAQDVPGGSPGCGTRGAVAAKWMSLVVCSEEEKPDLGKGNQSGGEILEQQVMVSLAAGVLSSPQLGHVDQVLAHPRGRKRGSASPPAAPVASYKHINTPFSHTGYINALL